MENPKRPKEWSIKYRTEIQQSNTFSTEFTVSHLPFRLLCNTFYTYTFLHLVFNLHLIFPFDSFVLFFFSSSHEFFTSANFLFLFSLLIRLTRLKQITWIDGLGNVLTTGIDYMKEPLPDSRRVTAKSILKLTPKKEHHNTTFTCQAQNTADRTYRSAKLLLEVSNRLCQHIFEWTISRAFRNWVKLPFLTKRFSFVPNLLCKSIK